MISYFNFFVLLILLSSPYYYLFICKYKVNNDKATYENIKKCNLIR